MHLTDDRCWGLQQVEATDAAVIAIRRARREPSWRVVTIVATVPCRRLQLALQALHKPKRLAQSTTSVMVSPCDAVACILCFVWADGPCA